jgi:hypothetical protein
MTTCGSPGAQTDGEESGGAAEETGSGQAVICPPFPVEIESQDIGSGRIAMSLHHRLRSLIFGLFIIVIAAAPLQTVRADTAPKPTMEFSFEYKILSAPAIVSGILEECSQADCSDAHPLMKGGPQHFDCDTAMCSSLAYSYSKYHRLRIEFSDGKTRQSNIFGKNYFYASYSVAVRENDLLVEEKVGEFAPFFSLEWILLCGAFVLVAGFLISIILLLVVALRAREYEESRKLYNAAWIVSLPTAVVILLVSLFTGMIIVLALETVIALGYAALRKRSRALVLTIVFLLTVITLPVFVVVVGGVLNPITTGAAWVFGTVVCVWLFDAGFLAVALRKEARFLEALLFSFALNVPVFGLGLVSIILRMVNS